TPPRRDRHREHLPARTLRYGHGPAHTRRAIGGALRPRARHLPRAVRRARARPSVSESRVGAGGVPRPDGEDHLQRPGAKDPGPHRARRSWPSTPPPGRPTYVRLALVPGTARAHRAGARDPRARAVALRRAEGPPRARAVESAASGPSGLRLLPGALALPAKHAAPRLRGSRSRGRRE